MVTIYVTPSSYEEEQSISCDGDKWVIQTPENSGTTTNQNENCPKTIYLNSNEVIQTLSVEGGGYTNINECNSNTICEEVDIYNSSNVRTKGAIECSGSEWVIQ